ncbi:glycosyltransferase family 39 protein [Candidatus Woesearchaeota archaeon]|nr:glycosyltransferase family 39 protein [Candidatus Woesearchaeota archaeon]
MKNTKNLIILFIIITTIKSLLSYFITSPSIFSDEYLYIKMSQSFFQNFNFDIHGMPSDTYLPIYPILISISFLFNDATVFYMIMKIINSILSSLIIIPAYLIAKEFVDEKKALYCSLIIALLPMSVTLSYYIISENIFHTLFLTSIYLIYKSTIDNSYKYEILSGISIGLTSLTKLAGLSLIIVAGIITIYKVIKKDYNQVPKKIVILVISLIIFSPWLIRNGFIFGFTINGVLGNYSNAVQSTEINYLNLVIWPMLYLSLLLISSLIIILPFNLAAIKEKLKDNKMKIFTIITFVTAIIMIVALSKYAATSSIKEETFIQGLTGRPIGRYIDIVLPLITLNGVITYFKYKKNIKKELNKIIIISIPLIILFSQLMFFSLLPLNNLSVSEIGIIKLIIENILTENLAIILTTTMLLAIAVLIIYMNKKNILMKINIIKIIAILFIGINIINFGVTYYNSKTSWYNHQQEQLSLWMKDHIAEDKIILIDENDCGNFNKETTKILCTKKRSTQLTALWINNKVIIDNINNKEADYIISTKNLNLPLVKKTKNEIYLYRTNNREL